MRRFASARIIYLSIGLNHVALPAKHHAHSGIFRNIFGDRACAGPGAGSDRRLAGGRRCRQHPRRAMQRQHVGRGCLGEDARAAATPTIPMSQNRTGRRLGMPILIDMKKKAGADQWEGQVYNAKDGQYYSSTIKPVDPDQLEIQGCVLGFLCGGETWTRVAGPIPSSPVNSMAKGATEDAAAALPRPPHRRRRRAQDHRIGRPGCQRPETGTAGAAGRSGRRYLPTPRHRGVCPLAPAGTAAPRQAS